MRSGHGTSQGLRSLPQREQEASRSTRSDAQRPDLAQRTSANWQAGDAASRTHGRRVPGHGHRTTPTSTRHSAGASGTSSAEDGGRIGVVLPRSALAAKGSTEFRCEVFSRAEGVDVTMLLNNKQWVFEEVSAPHTPSASSPSSGGKPIAQPSLSADPSPSFDRYTAGIGREPAVFYGTEIQTWNDTASLPLLPTDDSVEVFAQLRKAPRLDLDDRKSWRARPQSEICTHERQAAHGP